jgi:SAM-dependent methyltransferase
MYDGDVSDPIRPVVSIGRMVAICLVALVGVGLLFRFLYWTIPDRGLHRLFAAISRPLRRWGLDPTTVARRIGVRTGMRVLVVDLEDTATTRAIARDVGASGLVEAVTPTESEAERTRMLLVDSGISNVRVVATPLNHVPFEDDSFDAVCFLSAFGHPTDPLAFLAEAWRVLRPSGRLSASDVISDPAFRLRRSVERWGEAVGFESLEHFGNLLAYTVNFRKPIGVSTAR